MPPFIVSVEKKEEDTQECPICLDSISERKIRTLKCGHKFHDDCINIWKKEATTCPYCRAKINDDYDWQLSIHLQEKLYIFHIICICLFIINLYIPFT